MQVPASFQYRKATSIDEALALLARYGPESRVLAGGHSLLPMMKLRLAHPEALIDINECAEIAGIRVDETGIGIGAMARHADVLASSAIGEQFPILHDAERVIADPIVRNRGTVGGSLCQADPSEDLSAAFAALRAELLVRGPDGERTIPVREFFLGPYQTALADAEILLEIQLPRHARTSAYLKVDRKVGDWAVAAAGVVLDLVDGVIAEVGIGLTAVGAARFVAEEAEDFLRGGPAREDRFVEAGRIAAAHCAPVADQRGPVDFKRHLAGELTTRALRKAVA
ncbi:MAG TPA: xanthine dehydrogenase family protein subunit M [Pseudonocardiaceae bacterium]|jgi:carbon-monoxide dehydrogenase medium subunit